MKRIPCRAAARLLCTIAVLASSQVHAAGPGPVLSLGSGKCLDLERGSTSDGPVVIQFDCHEGANQRWSFVDTGGGGYRIVSQLSNKCIGIDRAGPGSSGAIVQSTCGAGASEQLWRLVGGGGGYFIKAIASGLCLDVPGASTISGAKLVAWRCTEKENQAWRLAP